MTANLCVCMHTCVCVCVYVCACAYRLTEIQCVIKRPTKSATLNMRKQTRGVKKVPETEAAESVCVIYCVLLCTWSLATDWPHLHAISQSSTTLTRGGWKEGRITCTQILIALWTLLSQCVLCLVSSFVRVVSANRRHNCGVDNTWLSYTSTYREDL